MSHPQYSLNIYRDASQHLDPCKCVLIYGVYNSLNYSGITVVVSKCLLELPILCVQKKSFKVCIVSKINCISILAHQKAGHAGVNNRVRTAEVL